ncbi:CvpA family protein [Thermohalobacter berrensis]|nr:CvpA family protein [Thermohalobacter berrensis]
MDYIIILILLFNSLGGFRNGFIISAFNLVGFILSIYIAKLYYPILSEYIKANPAFFDKVKGFVEKFSQNIPLYNDIYSGEMLINMLTERAIDIISIVLVFFIAKILIYLAITILDNIAQLPILKQVNHISGLVFGLAKGILILYVLFALLTPVIKVFPDSFIAKGTLNSTFGYYLYNYNIIISYLKMIGFLS